MVADAAFGGPAREIVLDPVAGIDLELPVVALERDREDDLSGRARQKAPDTGVEIEQGGRLVEISDRVSKDGNFPNGSEHRQLTPKRWRRPKVTDLRIFPLHLYSVTLSRFSTAKTQKRGSGPAPPGAARPGVKLKAAWNET